MILVGGDIAGFLGGPRTALFDGTVDAVHFAEHQMHDADIAVQSMPYLKILSDDRLKARAEESQRRFRELIAPLVGATFTGDEAMTRDKLVRMGRFASLVVIGRPGADDENAHRSGAAGAWRNKFIRAPHYGEHAAARGILVLEEVHRAPGFGS